MSSNG
jgi:serine/threonine protein kinase